MNNIRSFGSVPNCANDAVYQQQIQIALCRIIQLLTEQPSQGVDSEIALLCNPEDENAPIIVRYKFGIINDTSTVISTDAWNLDGTAFTGDTSTLVSCDGSIAGEWNVNLNQVGGEDITLGQKIMDSSIPVVVASDQSTLPVKIISSQDGSPIGDLSFRPVYIAPSFNIDGNDITANSQTISTELYAYNAGSPAQDTVTVTISPTSGFSYAGITITFEAYYAGVWFPVQMTRLDSGVVESNSGSLSNITRIWNVSVPGASQFRISSTSYSSGSARVDISSTASGVANLVSVRTAQAVWNTLVQYAFGSITNSFTVAMTNTAILKRIKFRNTTNVDLIVSYDGTINNEYILTNETFIDELAAMSRDHRGNIWVKYAAGAPASGSLIISGYA